MTELFHNACRSVVMNCSNPYAQAYAKAGLELTTPDAIRVQCLYILSNLSHWRGDEARRIKLILKSIGKVK